MLLLTVRVHPVAVSIYTDLPPEKGEGTAHSTTPLKEHAKEQDQGIQLLRRLLRVASEGS